MRHFILVSLLLVAPLFSQQSSVLEIPYRSVPEFLKPPPDLYFGEVAGVAVNSKATSLFSRGEIQLALPTRRVPRNFSSLARTASSCVRSATTCTLGPTRTR